MAQSEPAHAGVITTLGHVRAQPPWRRCVNQPHCSLQSSSCWQGQMESGTLFTKSKTFADSQNYGESAFVAVIIFGMLLELP